MCSIWFVLSIVFWVTLPGGGGGRLTPMRLYVVNHTYWDFRLLSGFKSYFPQKNTRGPSLEIQFDENDTFCALDPKPYVTRTLFEHELIL